MVFCIISICSVQLFLGAVEMVAIGLLPCLPSLFQLEQGVVLGEFLILWDDHLIFLDDPP